MADPLHQFRAALAARSIVPPDPLLADGRLHRCDSEGKNGKGDAAYLLHLDGIPAGGFENHRDGLGWQIWRADAERVLSVAEQAAIAKRIDAARRERQAEQSRRQTEAAHVAQALWDRGQPALRHTYTDRKGIGTHRTRVLHGHEAGNAFWHTDEHGELRPLQGVLLLVPMYGPDKRLASLQAIDQAGHKSFLRGGKTAACYVPIGKRINGSLIVCEGFATGATLHQATGLAVACAFSANNLLAVGKLMRQRFPCVDLILCGDVDKSGVGQAAAQEAARAVGGSVALPPFTDAEREAGATDWNDLCRLRNGLGEVLP